ncbi:hypothetical protein ABPG77_005972 [Micractinium sp. CCAP 211/92]
MHPGPCGTEGCSLEEVVASVGCRELPTLDERRHLADRLAQRSSLPLARPLAAALQEQQAAAGRCAEEDAVWTYGACAAQPGGDVWSLLCLAKHAADAGGAALVQRHRRQLYAASLRLVHAAACGVHAAPHQWDAWLAGGVHAALGSFLVLRSSGGGAAELAAQLAAVSALVTEAASQEGGAELWLLQDVLAQQEGRLSLEAALAGAP